MKPRSSRPYIPRKLKQPTLSSHYLDSARQLSIIIPTYNESASIVRTLMALQPLRNSGHEVILVDGGSEDDTLDLAEELVDQIIVSNKGRARQMNAGARHAWGDTLLFLHADTILPNDVIGRIGEALAEHQWGRFKVRLSGRHILFRLIEVLMNLRSCVTGIATGDQAIFISKSLFQQLGGYADIPLMEDIEICRRLRRHGRPACIKSAAITSSRRWEQNGILRTVLLMWRLRLAYRFGVPPSELYQHYYGKK